MKLTIDPRLLEQWPRSIVVSLLRRARPPGVTSFEVELRPQRGSESAKVGDDGRLLYPWRAHHFSGFAFPHSNRVVIRIPVGGRRKIKAPYVFAGTPNSAGYQGHRVFSRTEALLHILAHELRHLWQRKVRRGRRVWGSRGRYSERDADCYALRVVRSYRREGVVLRGTLPIVKGS